MKYLSILFLLMPVLVSAQSSSFSKGPVFANYGENVAIKGGLANPETQRFKVAFDVYNKNEGTGALRGFNSVARFINMHVRAGVPIENIEVAVVVHGEASFELLSAQSYNAKFEKPNASAELLDLMTEKGVKVYLCGQSASYHGISTDQLLPGIQMSLSAMTAHALLQQQGFSLNPF